jgi:hypothetical protein
MTIQQIVDKLKTEGIDLVADHGNIKARPASKITDEHKALISSNKADLLSYLNGQCNERNCGSLPHDGTVGTVCDPGMKMSNEDLGTMVAIFKTLWTIKQRAKGIGTDDSFTKKQKSNKSEVA